MVDKTLVLGFIVQLSNQRCVFESNKKESRANYAANQKNDSVLHACRLYISFIVFFSNWYTCLLSSLYN